MPRRGSRRPSRPSPAPPAPVTWRTSLEAEVLPGLAPFVMAALRGVPGVRAVRVKGDAARADAVAFELPAGGDVPEEALRMVTALHRVVAFDVPRPKALLADAHVRTVREVLGDVTRDAARRGAPFHGVRLEAAGRESPVMQRLAQAYATAVGLPVDLAEGDLKVRVRPGREAGWEVLVRTTPRPLSARAWRVANLPGGLNACVAAAAWRMLGTTEEDRVVNLACGSGTLLIERAGLGLARHLLGIDVDEAALEAARANLAAAGVQAELRREDATATSLPAGACSVVVTDPPWGDVHGGETNLEVLYGGLLDEAARILEPGGRALVIVHALRAFDAALAQRRDAWQLDETLRVFHGGHWPAMHRLTLKNPGGARLLDSTA